MTQIGAEILLARAPCNERRVRRFYNGRGTREQWIREGKHAVEWMRLSCHQFKNNAVRVAVFVLGYNLCNFLRRLVLQMAKCRSQ